MNKLHSYMSVALLGAALFPSHAHAQFGRLLGSRKTAVAPTATVAQPEAPEVAVGQRAAGVIRIGVVEPASTMGSGPSEINISTGLRKEWMRYLTGPTLESVRLSAALPAQVETEAKLKECDYILYSAISQKGQADTTAKRAGLLKSASSMANMVPMIGVGKGVAGMLASTAARSAMDGAVEATGAVKSKSDVTLDYQLVSLGATPTALKNSETAKADQDGQNVITPLIEHAATAITNEIKK